MKLNLNPYVHKITLAIVALHAFVLEYGNQLPISPKAQGYVLLGATLVGMLIKTFQDPPVKAETPKDPPAGTGTVTRIIAGLALLAMPVVALSLMGGCGSSLQDIEAQTLPALTQGQAIAIEVEQLADLAKQYGVTPAAIQSAGEAATQKHFGEAVELIYQGLAVAAKAGHAVPANVVATVEVLRAALAAQSVQDGMRALSGPSKD